MDALHILNFIVWVIVAGGVVWATHSKHVCDGIFIKIGMASLAFGALANAQHPNFHSQLWIGVSIAAIVVFFLTRIIVARLTKQKPVFLVF